MKILSFTKERKEIEEMFVTQIEYNGKDYTLASYVYNGELAEDETAPSFWNVDEFNELDEKIRKQITDLINKNLLKEYS